MRQQTKDFKCECGCGQKVRFVLLAFKNGVSLDIGYMKKREKTQKSEFGIVLRTDGNKDYQKLLKFLPTKW